MNPVLIDSFLDPASMPTPPAVVFDVLRALRRGVLTVPQIADTVVRDPVMARRLLGLAGFRPGVDAPQSEELTPALAQLGLRTVRILVPALALFEALRKQNAGAAAWPGIWKRSILASVAARDLAQLAGTVRSQEAFVGGLLQDVGVILSKPRAQMQFRQARLIVRNHGGKLIALEEQLVGQSHGPIGGMALARWGMPETLCHAVAAHHGLDMKSLQARTRDLAEVLRFGDQIAGLFVGEEAPSLFSQVKREVMAMFSIAPPALESMLSRIPERFAGLARLLDVEISPVLAYEPAITADAQTVRKSAQTTSGGAAVHAAAQAHEQTPFDGALSVDVGCDRLTGLCGRALFLRELAAKSRKEAPAGDSTSETFGVLMIKLADVRSLNRRYGSEVGDLVLRTAAEHLGAFRDMAIMTARTGGKEFVMLVPDSAERELHELAEKIEESLAGASVMHGRKSIPIKPRVAAMRGRLESGPRGAEKLLEEAEQLLTSGHRQIDTPHARSVRKDFGLLKRHTPL